LSLSTLLLFGLFVAIVPVSAGCNPAITPNPPTAGAPFNISGITDCLSPNVSVYSGSGCSGTTVFSMLVGTQVSYSVTVPGQPAGPYSVSDGACVNFTIDPALIPEYPLGFPLLAILTVIAYGMIRRRTRKLDSPTPLNET
jgi:hypothetical protein